MNVVPLFVAAALPALSASLDTTATSVGGRLTMRMVVDAPPEWVVEAPALPAELGAFRVRSVHAAGGGRTRRAGSTSPWFPWRPDGWRSLRSPSAPGRARIPPWS